MFTDEFIDLYLKEKESFLDEINYIRSQFSSDKKNRKELKSLEITKSTQFNEWQESMEFEISKKCYNTLVDMEREKVEGILPLRLLPEVKKLYLCISKYGGRLTSRYFKLPIVWLNLGIFGGILEDLIVVLRTPVDIFGEEKHLFSCTELIEKITSLMNRDDSFLKRFFFLGKLFLSHEKDEVRRILLECINLQRDSKRIGIYIDDEENFYAIQGLYKVNYDSRVVRTLHLARCDSEEELLPPYAVHFTRLEIASAIWGCQPTKNPRAKGMEIPVGEIVCFPNTRAIHLITDVSLEGDHFRISQKLKDIRNRMQHGISEGDGEEPRRKYEAGLVVDVRKLLSSVEDGKVQINEIGTMLVSCNIPRECIISALIEDEDISTFWRE